MPKNEVFIKSFSDRGISWSHDLLLNSRLTICVIWVCFVKMWWHPDSAENGYQLCRRCIISIINESTNGITDRIRVYFQYSPCCHQLSHNTSYSLECFVKTSSLLLKLRTKVIIVVQYLKLNNWIAILIGFLCILLTRVIIWKAWCITVEKKLPV